MFLQLTDISKAYSKEAVLQNISFGLPAHGTLSVLGKSGCGKSTLLKIIAGIEAPDAGTVALDQTDITRKNPNERNIVYLFQEPLLFPNMNVFENIAFGLRIRKIKEQELIKKVNEMGESLQVADQLKKMPHQLSGGQKQRVAFGRALIINPPLILLDEPFSSLDVETRSTMQQLYKSMAERYNITALFVTHDLKEALLMGDQVAYMENGLLQIFTDKKTFINDPRTGVLNEVQFWNTL